MMTGFLNKYSPVAIIVLIIILSGIASAHLIPDAQGRYVNDFAGVLTSEEIAHLEEISQEARDANGTELVFVTVKSVGGDFDTIRVDYFNEQGIGQKANDNGVLVLLATEDRKIGITTGRGIEAVLPDSLTKEIDDTQGVPYFKNRGQEQWGKGLIAIGDALLPYIKGEKFAKTGGIDFGRCGCWLPILLFYLAIVAIFAVIGYTSRVRCPVCRGKVKLIKTTTVLEPSTETPGLEKREFECTVCKHKFIRSITTPALGKPSTSGGFWGGWSSSSSGGWSSGGGGGGGGSFGGGSSGGGGSSSSF